MKRQEKESNCEKYQIPVGDSPGLENETFVTDGACHPLPFSALFRVWPILWGPGAAAGGSWTICLSSGVSPGGSSALNLGLFHLNAWSLCGICWGTLTCRKAWTSTSMLWKFWVLTRAQGFPIYSMSDPQISNIWSFFCYPGERAWGIS